MYIVALNMSNTTTPSVIGLGIAQAMEGREFSAEVHRKAEDAAQIAVNDARRLPSVLVARQLAEKSNVVVFAPAPQSEEHRNLQSRIAEAHRQREEIGKLLKKMQRQEDVFARQRAERTAYAAGAAVAAAPQELKDAWMRGRVAEAVRGVLPVPPRRDSDSEGTDSEDEVDTVG